ncbi:hypothetical protein Tco_0561433 [Tanacetum coccineum]
MAKQVELNKKKGKGTGQGENRPVWNNVQRLNHQNKFVPKAVLTKTSIFSVNTAKQNPFSQAAETSTARKVNTARPIVNEIRQRNNFYKSHSPIKRPFNKSTAPKANFTNHKVNTTGDKTVCAVRGYRETAIKASAATASTNVNREVELTASIDGQAKTITEASLRRHLKLEDYGGISSLPNTKIFEQLALIGTKLSTARPKLSTDSTKIESMKLEAMVEERRIFKCWFHYHTTNGHQFTMSNRHQELASPEQTAPVKSWAKSKVNGLLLKTSSKLMIVDMFNSKLNGYQVTLVIAIKQWLSKSKRLTDGIIYWSTLFGSFILSFDLKSEKFGQVSIPERFVRTYGIWVAKANESLGLLEYYKEGGTSLCGVWMRKDDINNPFTKIYTVKVEGKSVFFKVLGFRKNGEVLLQLDDDDSEGSQIEVYEPSSGRINSVGISGERRTFCVWSYMETLLLLDQSNLIIH